MTQNFSLNSVQSALGVYFKSPSTLETAFTHVSYSDTENNEGLIFLGEKLLDFVISDYVCTRYPFSVGNRLASRLDDFKKTLNYNSFISSKGLQGYINLSRSSEKLRDDKALHGEVFLAVLAAIYKDGGLPSLKAFILPLLRAIDSEDHYPPKRVDLKSNASKDAASKAEASVDKKDEMLAKIKISTATVSDKTKKDAEAVSEKTDADNAPSKKKKSDKALEEASEKTAKKGVNIFKAIIPSKKSKKDSEKDDAAVTDTEAVENAEQPRRSFIRDALAPVSLPESMRNPKPKKPYKHAEEKTALENNEQKTADNTEKKAEKTVSSQNMTGDFFTLNKKKNEGSFAESQKSACDDSENYKSLLQEYIQKNIRSANVLIKYNTATRINGIFETEVTLDGHPLAKGEGFVKKSAEKAAAKSAYEQITDPKAPLYSWFNSLSAQGIAATDKASDNYVSRLNEYYQKKSHSSAAPLTYEPRPSGTKKTFSVAVVFNGEELAVGTGHTVKDAKQDAAKRVCQKLKI